jgi:glycosyltransferase involved in cell wall biosynthesis
MRIGFDGMPLSQPLAGVGHYTLELARTMAQLCPGDEIEIVSPRPYMLPSGDDGNGWPGNLSLVRAPANLLNRRWWAVGLPRYLARSPVDLFHGTNFEIPLWVRQKRATVLTVHDLSQFLHPDTHEGRSARRAQRRLPLMTRAATMIITPTEAVRRELRAHLKVAGERVIAIPEAARKTFRPVSAEQADEVKRRLGIGAEFLLFVGTIEPRKDLLTLVGAFEQVAQAHGPNLQLVITGERGWLVDDLFARIGSSAIADRIILTGYLSDEEICALYSTCRAFVYPSIYEGFGLPPLEAMACGAPVIASRLPSIVEVCDEAALLFDPQSINALAEAIAHLIYDEAARRQLSSAGLQRAAQFSWEQTARATREVYDEALKRFEGRKAQAGS